MSAKRRVTICLLTYGDHLDYFRRALLSVLQSTPAAEYELRLGFNDAPKSFQFALGRLMDDWRLPPAVTLPSDVERLSFTAAGGLAVRIWNSPVNLYKEPMCRLLYHDVPLETDYTVWFDDDSYVAPGWWPALAALMERGVQYIGQPWWVFYLPGQLDMIRAMPWYRDVPFDDRDGKPGTHFMTGGFVAIRTDCLMAANFPDVDFVWKEDRLRQYGGDTLLGEIARQLGWSQAKHDTGIKVNVDLNDKHPAPRRGGTGKQFGSDVDIVIK